MLRALFRRFLAPQVRRRDRRPVGGAFRPRLESLEDRVVPSTVTWINSGDGDWNVGSNWSSGAKPGTGDDVVIDSNVKVTHSSGSDSVQSLSVKSGTLDLTGGSLDFSSSATVDGSLLIDGGMLNLTNKTLAGTGSTTVESGASWTLTHSTINTTLDNQGTLTAKSGVDLTNTFSNDSGAKLTVVGDATGTVDFQQLRIANGFTNDGTIELTTDATNHYVTLGVTTGTLTNSSDGVIHGLAGGGGPETLQTQLDNQGTITSDGPLTVSKNGTFTDTNSGTINVKGADMSVSNGTSGLTTFKNTGDIEISSGRTFAVQYNTIQFEEDGTDGGTINGPGTLDLYGANAVFDGGFTTANDLNMLVHFSTLTSSDTLTISSGSTLEVQYNATVKADVVNDGTIDLTSIVGANGCDFTVSGTLTNASDGTILSDKGTGGTRTINAKVDNEGTITVNIPLTITKSSVVQVNNGTIDVNSGSMTVNLSGSNDGFTNNGTISVADGTTFAVSGGPLTNFSNGTLSGGTYDLAGTFRFDNAAITTNDAGLTLDGTNAKVVNQSNASALSGLKSNTANGSLTLVNGAALSLASFSNSGYVGIDDTAHLTVSGTYTQQSQGITILGGGTLTAGQGIDIEGGVIAGTGTLDGNVSNSGTLEVGVPDTPGVLTITGDYTQTSAGDLYVEIGGKNAGTDYDQLQIDGNANLDGALSVLLINGYTQDGQSTFQVLTAGAVHGTFAAVLNDGASFSVTYDSGDVTLQ
jgi:hypothetical protein